MFRLLLNFAPKASLVTGRERVAEYLNFAPLVETRDTLHQVRRRVVAEVRRHIANTNATSTVEQTLGVGILTSTKTGNLQASSEE